MVDSQKIKHETTIKPRIYAKEMKAVTWVDTCTPQLLVPTMEEQPKTPMNECWINNTWCAYTLGKYSVQRGKEILI